MNEIRGSEQGIGPYHHHAPTRYGSYQAILVCCFFCHDLLSESSSPLAIISCDEHSASRSLGCGLTYIVIHIPRTSERPIFHCSPIMRFCLGPGQQPNAQAPLLWSLLVYRLLTERFNVSDDILNPQLYIPVPSGSTCDAERCKNSARQL